MTIYHTILLKFKQETSAEEMEEIRARRVGFLSQIPSIKSIKTGQKLRNRFDQDYDQGIILRFDDEEALKAYYPHPVHREYEEWILPYVQSILVFDINVDE